MNKQFIIFNLDDTLAHCNKYFDEVIKKFGDLASSWFPADVADKQQILEKQLEIDLASVKQHGITSEHFPQSFIDTYVFFSGKMGEGPDPGKMKMLQELGESVYDAEVEPFPYMYETLDTLKDEGHELFLHTGGDPRIQNKKISQLELAAYFDNRVFISTFKDTHALDHILKQYPFEKRRTWMVGNSIRTDIIPGLENGINVIYIPAEHEWEYNVTDITAEPQGAHLTLHSLNDVPEAIQQHSQ
ncbi:HAD family hydrolase [Paenibacillus thalictri]|uniref:HAD family hydrolase n=1 Tax=Paenibacillus thalictri TaxID=2527873 RepID=A0A4Q9DZV0_9BACL|nr:HAD family hydrolase [Paenibacillus thalictri]TBL81690.1 HAD family hydrolase [Paenibacillus thalictri]